MSLPRYPEYKQSGVEWLGEVPVAWNVKRLRFACQINPSKSEVADEPRNSEVSFLPMEAIGEDGSLDLERTRPIGELYSGAQISISRTELGRKPWIRSVAKATESKEFARWREV